MTLRTLALFCVLPLAACPTTGPAPADDSAADTDTDSGEPDDTGDTDVYDDCPDYDASPLGACLVWDGAAPEGFETTNHFTVAVSGTVEAVGVGPAPVTCAYDEVDGYAPLGNLDRVGQDDAAWVRVVDAAGERWTLAWRLPGVAAPAEGDAVTIDVTWRRGFSADGFGTVSLRTSTALLGWFATEGGIPSELPTGLAATLGDPVCIEGGDCFERTVNRIEVAEGAASAVLAPGDAADLATLHVMLGGSDTWLPTGTCEDGPENRLELGVRPL